MRKIIAILAAALTLALTACAGSDNANSSSVERSSSQRPISSAPESSSVQTNSSESSSRETAPSAPDSEENGSGILIAYFTAAENSGVDAVASASFSTVNGKAVGRLRAIADMIAAKTGGELFSIRTATVYPADGGALIDFASEEQSAKARPELTTHIDDLDKYDTIFIGYPNWWYDMPMALYSFFEEYDFSGKTLIPFNVHNGSRLSGTVNTIKGLEPNAVVIENAFTVNERNVPGAESDILSWLAELGY